MMSIRGYRIVRVRVLIVLAALLLPGCRDKFWTEDMPDRFPGYGIRCQGSMAICYRRAAKLCPQGYTIYGAVPNDGLASGGKIYVPKDQVYAGPSTPLEYEWQIRVSCGKR
jgi:hypothetical protein